MGYSPCRLPACFPDEGHCLYTLTVHQPSPSLINMNRKTSKELKKTNYSVVSGTATLEDKRK